MKSVQVAANDRSCGDQDEAFPVRRPVARDSLSEWQLSKGDVASSGTYQVW